MLSYTKSLNNIDRDVVPFLDVAAGPVRSEFESFVGSEGYGFGCAGINVPGVYDGTFEAQPSIICTLSEDRECKMDDSSLSDADGLGRGRLVIG